MKYVLKSWVDEKTVYSSDSLFYSEKDLWTNVFAMKKQFPCTYAVIIRG